MDNRKEIWKDISGYEGLYQVSTFGRVRSLDRLVKSPRQESYISKGRLLAPNKNQRGYIKAVLCKDGKTKTHLVHLLVAKAFLGNPNNKTCVNHRNSIRDDNYVLNLEWASYRENNRHRYTKKENNCKYPGVHLYWGQINRYAIQLNVNKTKLSAGPFDTQEEAYREYVELCKLHGIENNYSLLKSERVLWIKPYYQKSSYNYTNR